MATTEPQVEIKNGSYYRPYTPPEFPEIPEDYLPENVRLHFEFGPHGHSDTFDMAAKRLEDSDIYIPEGVGYTEDEVALMQRVTKSGPTQFNRDLKNAYLNLNPEVHGFHLAELSALQGTYKVIRMADADQATLDALRTPPPQTLPTTLEERLAYLYGMFYQEQIELDVRDATMLKNIGACVTKAVADYPKLRDKHEVKVLATLGSNHMSVYDQLATHPNVSGATWFAEGEKAGSFAIPNMVWEKIRSNTPVTQEEMAKALIASAVSTEGPNRSNQETLKLQIALIETISQKPTEKLLNIMWKIMVGGNATREEFDQYNRRIEATTRKIGRQ